MKSISPEEFIIGLLVSKTQLKIDIRTLYRFEQISRTQNLYCGFNFNDLLQFSYLYPTLFISNRTELTIKAANNNIIVALKTIYGISDDLSEIKEIWEKL